MHESIHLAQFQQYGPLRFAWEYIRPRTRFVLEQDAYRQEFIAVCQTQGPDALRYKRDYYVNLLSGSAYYYCAPRPTVQAWVDQTIATVIGDLP